MNTIVYYLLTFYFLECSIQDRNHLIYISFERNPVYPILLFVLEEEMNQEEVYSNGQIYLDRLKIAQDHVLSIFYSTFVYVIKGTNVDYSFIQK